MRTLTGKEIAKYYKEFPFLEDAIDHESARDRKHNILKIQVQVADAASLYIILRPNLPPKWIPTPSGEYIGYIDPSLWAYNVAGNFEKGLWPDNSQRPFLKDVIVNNNIHTVMMVNECNWWRVKEGSENKFGEFSHTEYRIYIFKSPKQGLWKLVQESDLAKNVPIMDSIGIAIASRKVPEAFRAIRELDHLAYDVGKSIGKSLWRRIKKCGHSEMTGVFGKAELQVYVLSGRVRLSFQLGKDCVNFDGVESDFTKTTFGTMNCSVDTAKFIVSQVIDNWSAAKLTSV